MFYGSFCSKDEVECSVGQMKMSVSSADCFVLFCFLNKISSKINER